MKPTTGKCMNAECSQFGVEKSFDVAMTYGYVEGRAAICPECEAPLRCDRATTRAITRLLQYVHGN